MKICCKCKKEKELTQFHKSNRTKDGLKPHCKICRHQEYLNSIPIKESNESFVGPKIPNNIKLCSFCGLFNTLDNVIYRKDKNGNIIYQLQCKKCKSNKLKIWRNINPEKHKLTIKKYRQSERGKATKKLYRQRLKIRVHDIIREEIRRLVRNNRMKKTDTTCKYLGCSDEFFINYIESQFESWMNWGNHGPGYLRNKHGKPIYDKNGLAIPTQEWSFDHIDPCENFDLETNPELAYVCFNYKNYQPLLTKLNSEKGDLLPDGSRARDIKY